MNCLEISILILVVGIVSMIEICTILAGVSRMIDAKTKAKIDLTTSVFKMEMQYIDKLFDKYMDRIEKMIDKAVEKHNR